ncbi:hypothetical protein PMAYCL1PPCAC_16099, partial [Pristionchus mayeri]
MIVMTMPGTISAFDFNARFAVSTTVPDGGHIHFQVTNIPITFLEFVTIFMFEYLFRFNCRKLREAGLSLTERYQIAENVRMLELLRPLARFHGATTCAATIAYMFYARSIENDPSYPIFEETINFVQLQGILLPVIFMRHAR